MNKWFILVTVITFFIACSKQSPDEVASDYIDSTSELERGEACRQLNLSKDILELNNTKNLFLCSNWNKKFPTLYQKLNTIDVNKWNSLTSKVNEHFFNNRTNRDKLINIVEEMDRKGGLDEFAKVITALSDSNFFGNINILFQCASDSKNCPTGTKISKEDLKNFYKFFHVSKVEVSRAVSTINGFNDVIGKTGVSFFEALSSDLNSSEFISGRYHLFDQFVKKFEKDDVKDEIRFLRNIFSAKNDEGKSKILDLVIKNMKVEDFTYLLEYASVKDTDQWKDFKLLNTLIETDIVCEGFLDDRAMKVDISEHLKLFIRELFEKDRNNFFAQSIESLGVLKTAQNLCGNFATFEDKVVNPISLKTETHSLNYVNAVSKTTKLMMLSSYYDLFNFMQEQVPNTVKNKELFLLKFFSSDFHVSFVEIIQVLDQIDSGLLGSMYELLANADQSLIDDITFFLEWIENKNDEELKSLSKIWKTLSEDGKFFVFNFIDAHYKDGVDIRLLFNFYSVVLSSFSNEIVDVLDNYFNDMDTFLVSLEEITSKLGGEDIIEDYRSFFSRDHFIEIIKIISRGGVEQTSTYLTLENNPTERKPLPIRMDLNSVLMTDSSRVECVNAMTDKAKTFYDLISKVPAECSEYVKENVFYKIIHEFNDLGKMIYGEGYKWNSYSFFSEEMMKSSTLLLKYLSDNYKSIDGEGVTSVVTTLSNYLEDDNRRGNATSILEGLNLFNSTEQDSLLSSLVEFYSKDQNFPFVKDLIKGLRRGLEIGHDYHLGLAQSELSETEFKFDEAYDCKNYHNLHMGSIPCPSYEKLLFIKDSLVTKFLKKNEENPRALELLLRAILPRGGLSIPYDNEKQSIKRLTLGETIHMLYDTTNSTLESNKVEIEYQEIPKAVDAYFQNDWEVDKDMMKGAPEEKSYIFNTMERIETVIRDVRFDENYLGAHYMNSVAKAENYDETVDSKYNLMGLCVPLKFCGKFMDKAQHRLGRNARRTFPGLSAVNIENEWKYGDYMKALLQVVVASSPSDSQISSVIDKKIFGVKISIPVLQSKKDLLYHNGKILTDLSMVNTFTNVARTLRDRIGRSDQEFKNFINGSRIKRFDELMFKNTNLNSIYKLVESILITGQSNGFIDSVVKFFYNANYTEQRLLENALAKASVIATYIDDDSLPQKYKKRYQGLDALQIEKLIDWIVVNYDDLSNIVPLKDKEFLTDLNYVIDILLSKLEKGDSEILILLNELFYFITSSEDILIQNLDKILKDKKSDELKIAISAVGSLFKDLSKYDVNKELPRFIKDLEQTDKINLKALQGWFAVSSAVELCYNSKCFKNTSKREVNKIVNYLIENKSSRLYSSVNYLAQSKKRELDKLLRKIFSSLTIQ